LVRTTLKGLSATLYSSMARGISRGWFSEITNLGFTFGDQEKEIIS